MWPWSEILQISCKPLFAKGADDKQVEDLGITLRIKAPSCHLSNTVIKRRKLMQGVKSCLQHSDDVWNSNNSISFAPNSVLNRRPFPVCLLFVLHLLCASCVDVQYQSPQNVAINIGERVVMNCSSDDTVHPCQNMVWAHYPANNPDPTFIFMGGNLSSLVTDYISIADSNDGKCNLEIKTRTSAEGKYECFSTSSTGKKESASLIILDGYPECVFKTGGEYFNITCWVQYFGDWAPTIEWIGQNSIGIGSYESFTFDKIVGATLMISRNAHSRHKFILKFNKQGKKKNITAINVPTYEWISPIFVLGEDGVKQEGANETTCPQQMSNAESFGFNGRVVILSLFLSLS